MIVTLPVVNSTPFARMVGKNECKGNKIFSECFNILNDGGKNSYNKKISSCNIDDVDLLVIGPWVFKTQLQKLKNHKENEQIGIKTAIEYTEHIYEGYNGHDKAEKIKYCIKDYYDNGSIGYVLLFGGLKGLFSNHDNENDWYTPARYSWLDLDGFPESKYLCDLYFADLYDEDKNFQTWNDADYPGDEDKFGEWRYASGREVIDSRDLIPDVAVGRLPCRNEREACIIVDKIINYEKNVNVTDEWFTNIGLVGSDCYQDENDVIEGVIANEFALHQMNKRYNFTPITFWPEENSDESDLNPDIFPENYFKSMNNPGFGFTYIVGHGDPGKWTNHYNHKDFWNFTFIRCFPDLTREVNNGNKLPVAVVHGCNLAQYDVTIDDLISYQTWRSFCWMLTCKESGGSIASLGSTAMCYDQEGENYTDIYAGFFSSHFFEKYGIESEIIGDIWKSVITDYVNQDEWDVRNNIIHTKMVEEWTLIGDPSLKIGGYREI